MIEKRNLQITELKDRFDQRGIKSVIFDLDDTLIDTSMYYKYWMKKSAKDFFKKFLLIDLHPSEINKIYQYGVEVHNNAGRPLLIYQYMIEGISQYLKERRDIDRREYHKKLTTYIPTYLKDFYYQSPDVKEGSFSVLNTLVKMNCPFGIYSHAQDNWTKIKIDKIKEEYFERYFEDINIPFVTTPIDMKKDTSGWIEAAKALNFSLNTSLVVGDSFASDIKPAMKAGCNNLIYIPRYKDSKVENGIDVVSDISQIFDNF